MLADVLYGSHTKKIYEANLNRLQEYGALGYLSKAEILRIIEWLMEKHFILQTKSMYPVLHPTYEGIHYSEVMTKEQLNELKEYMRNNEEDRC